MSCIICYNERKLIQTVCNHFFCKDCLKQWIIHNRSCPLCRQKLSWDIKEEFIDFLEKIKNKNISSDNIIENFIFYYQGKYFENFSSIRSILNFINYKDEREYNFNNIIDAIENDYPSKFIFYIFIKEIVRYKNKSIYKKLKNLLKC